ncbi:2-amino-4-hydroxy-6-hydroxymethyldihydropteridine diphosphokinase [Antarctobacter jejuensis]|uniref:2-amino-4-hydroxy-6- hydroxymethyldihydropteridine diphosphokinase n=1 Tax=Antarctobacter jejuensis TaxID=1439938 RepID=UPI003FD545EB
MTQEFLVALGSNLGSYAGSPAQTLAHALCKLTSRNMVLRRISRFFATPCFPAGAGPDYVNACVALEYDGDAQSLLAILHQVEADFDRERVQRWGSRTLDLDLLAQGDGVLPEAATQVQWRECDVAAQLTRAPEQLILPHPRLQDRAFVLVPLADIAADWRHPLTGTTVAEMLAALPAADRAEARPI